MRARGRPLRSGCAWLLLLAALGCDESSPTEPGRGRAISVQEVTEALFFGTGRAGEGGSPVAVWRGFRRHARVQLLVASSVDRAALPHLARQVDTLNHAFGGFMVLQLVPTESVDPRPGFHQITLAEVSAEELLAITGEPGAGGTCREVSFSGAQIVSARCLLTAGFPRPEGDVHEVGHGLGFEHVREGSVPAMMNPSAPLSDFSPLEVEAIHRVFTSGLEPGATRSDFARLGLIGST